MKEFKKFNGTDWQTIQPKKYDLKEISGTPPFSFESDGGVLQDWSITGQTAQDGTPTPENPIMPSGCGERTENLFDGLLLDGHFTNANFSTAGNADVYKSIKVFLHAGTYTFSWGKNVNIIRLIIDGNYSQPPSITNTQSYSITITTDGYVGISFRDATSASTVWDVTTPIMLNTGSTALPYEPYGYKLPLAVNGEECPIYLGEVETTRRIKKLVLTGQESWIKGKFPPSGDCYQFYAAWIYDIGKPPYWMTSHFTNKYEANGSRVGEYFSIYPVVSLLPEEATVINFKSYLAAQYAAGTPVTIWYVLKEPETAVVNEPLMKIGDYADEINLTNSGVNIPTIEGSNILTVNTTIQPSSMSIKKGLWKDCPLYEYTPYVSGVPPFTFKSDGQNLRDWSITGQTVQDGTPSPENPIMPSGCGVRTAQLFEGVFNGSIDSTGGIVYSEQYEIYYAKVEAGLTYTISGGYYVYAYYSGIPSIGISNSVDNTRHFTSQGNVITIVDGAEWIGVRVTSGDKPMLTEGSTAPSSYIPYGYKLPLTANGVEYPIYLGEVETTRRIKKLVLTGEENWVRATNGTFYSYFVTDYYNLEGRITICSHYIGDTNRSSTATVNDKACCFRISDTKTIYIRDTSFNSVTEFITYLAAQYAAGTPVTVWYVLAEPEAAVVNEPLMKIGDYADEISKTGTSMDIPTASGSNTLTVSTAVQPSEMTIESISQWIRQN